MIFDFCFYRYNLGHLSQYPTLEYAKEVIFESLELTLPLHGKRQFSLVKRGDSDKIRLYQIYNYIYNDNNDAFGICIVYHDKYPNDIEYMFKLCGATVVSILEEGKLLHLDSKGNIISDNRDLGNHYSTLNGHKVKFKDKILRQGTKLSPIPNNFYNNYEKQHVICQLSDKSWSLDELFENNNVVVITEEIEDENINNMRSFVKRSNETVKILNEQVKRLQEQLRQVEREKQKYEKQVKQATNNTTQHDVGDFFVWVIVGGFIADVLLCLIAPWIISSMPIWIKLALVLLTILGAWGAIYAIDDDHKGKSVTALGWSGFLAILFSTIITVYGIFGGFSDDNMDSSVSVVSYIESGDIDKNEIIDYEIRSEELDLTMPDWGNDLSDEEIAIARNEEQRRNRNDSLQTIKALPERSDTIKTKPDSSTQIQVKKEPPVIVKIEHNEPVSKPLTQKERFDNAKRRKDWNSMKQLADEGYSPAYLPLARHYMNNSRQHELAKKYAEKAKRAGIAGATEILNELENLDF